MEKNIIQKYKVKREEYDKKIRELDFELVDKDIELSDLLSKFKISDSENEKQKKQNEIYGIETRIKQIKEEKQELNDKINLKLISFKNDIYQNVKLCKDKKMKDKKSEVFIELKQIKDIYFNIDIIEERYNIFAKNEEKQTKIEPIIQIEETQKPLIQEIKNEVSNEIIENNDVKINLLQENKVFDIYKQRVIDFENLLKHMYELSKNYRTCIERALTKYIVHYDVVKSSKILENEIEIARTNFLNEMNKSTIQFEKNEKITDVNLKYKEELNNIKQIEEQITIIKSKSQDMKQKFEKLEYVCLVNIFAKQILNKLILLGFTNNLLENIEKNEVFQKVKNLTYNIRIKHIIEVSKWTKNIETKLKYYKINEHDFQYIINMIRQTENICNIKYEKIANSIILLCESHIKLEQVEEVVLEKNRILQEQIEVYDLLNNGISSVKKKYLKIPFVGRKVASILNEKMLPI